MKAYKPMQRTNLSRLFATVGVGALIAAASASLAQGAEHPQEHPSTPAKPAVSLDDVARHIESYVKEKSKQGAFMLRDSKTGQDLSLTLEKVHRERLSQVGPNRYFVCADFKGADGHAYDLDFFVQGTAKKNLKVAEKETSIHKVDGNPRYTWQQNQQTGVWEKKPTAP